MTRAIQRNTSFLLGLTKFFFPSFTHITTDDGRVTELKLQICLLLKCMQLSEPYLLRLSIIHALQTLLYYNIKRLICVP
jgi:hypothetical protein